MSRLGGASGPVRNAAANLPNSFACFGVLCWWYTAAPPDFPKPVDPGWTLPATDAMTPYLSWIWSDSGEVNSANHSS